LAILTAGAALVLGSLAIPGMAAANGKTASPEKSSTISAQSVSLDTPIAAQGKGHGKGHGKSGYRKGYRRGYRHGYSDSRHGYYGHGSRHGYGGGRCYGCDGPGSQCDRYGCAYGGPGYYGGGYGCGSGYACGEPYQYDCTRYAGPDGRPAQDPQCKYDSRCDCYAHTSEQGTEPAPEAGQGEQPRPY
jgi:hypothetical protein